METLDNLESESEIETVIESESDEAETESTVKRRDSKGLGMSYASTRKQPIHSKTNKGIEEVKEVKDLSKTSSRSQSKLSSTKRSSNKRTKDEDSNTAISECGSFITVEDNRNAFVFILIL